MSTTTVFGQVGTGQPSTHNKRNAVIVFTVIGLFALSFFAGRATAPSHPSSKAQVAHTQLSPADRAIVANDVAPLSTTVARQLSPADRAIVAGDVSSVRGPVATEQMSAANSAEVAKDVAPLSNNTSTTTHLSPADRAIVANDVAPVAPLNQANATSCIAGRPC